MTSIFEFALFQKIWYNITDYVNNQKEFVERRNKKRDEICLYYPTGTCVANYDLLVISTCNQYMFICEAEG